MGKGINVYSYHGLFWMSTVKTLIVICNKRGIISHFDNQGEANGGAGANCSQTYNREGEREKKRKHMKERWINILF